MFAGDRDSSEFAGDRDSSEFAGDREKCGAFAGAPSYSVSSYSCTV